MLPLVLLPGMNCTSELWAGLGRENAIHPVLDRASIAEQVGALLLTLPTRFVLAGHSLGAIVAMELALAAPGRVAGLCVTATNAKAPTPAQRAGWEQWLGALERGATARALQEDILPALVGERAALDRSELADRALAMGQQTGSARLRVQLEMQLSRTDLLGRLPAIDLPTLVVSGRHDGVCPPRTHTEIAAGIAGARLVTLDAGHLLPLERPAELGEALHEWLESRVSATATRGSASAS
jgi:pimeloyl-ACP methyl ester carboxylesterase